MARVTACCAGLIKDEGHICCGGGTCRLGPSVYRATTKDVQEDLTAGSQRAERSPRSFLRVVTYRLLAHR